MRGNCILARSHWDFLFILKHLFKKENKNNKPLKTTATKQIRAKKKKPLDIENERSLKHTTITVAIALPKKKSINHKFSEIFPFWKNCFGRFRFELRIIFIFVSVIFLYYILHVVFYKARHEHCKCIRMRVIKRPYIDFYLMCPS